MWKYKRRGLKSELSQLDDEVRLIMKILLQLLTPWRFMGAEHLQLRMLLYQLFCLGK
jgi:hypothetical protein